MGRTHRSESRAARLATVGGQAETRVIRHTRGLITRIQEAFPHGRAEWPPAFLRSCRSMSDRIHDRSRFGPGRRLFGGGLSFSMRRAQGWSRNRRLPGKTGPTRVQHTLDTAGASTGRLPPFRWTCSLSSEEASKPKGCRRSGQEGYCLNLQGEAVSSIGDTILPTDTQPDGGSTSSRPCAASVLSPPSPAPVSKRPRHLPPCSCRTRPALARTR